MEQTYSCHVTPLQLLLTRASFSLAAQEDGVWVCEATYFYVRSIFWQVLSCFIFAIFFSFGKKLYFNKNLEQNSGILTHMLSVLIICEERVDMKFLIEGNFAERRYPFLGIFVPNIYKHTISGVCKENTKKFCKFWKKCTHV